MLEKTFDPKAVEPRLYAQWETSGAFSPDGVLARDPDAATYSIVIPPPNVTGSLHIGHALNNTLQDILARSHGRDPRDAGAGRVRGGRAGADRHL